MGILSRWYRRRGESNLSTRPTVEHRRLNIEYLESRQLLAVLGVGFQLFRDTNADNQPDSPVDQVNDQLMVGETFWVDILVEDQTQRATDMGVISWPLNISWDPTVLQLDTNINPNPPGFPAAVPLPAGTDPSNAFSRLVTPSFPQQRFLENFVANNGPQDFNLFGLRGGALPNAGVGFGAAIGANGPEDFGRLQFTILTATDATPFTVQLAGSMAFADADPLNGFAPVDENDIPVVPVGNPLGAGNPFNTNVNVRFRDQESQIVAGANTLITEFIRAGTIPTEMTTMLSGYVYADHRGVNATDLPNGILDRDPGNGAPLESGLPNVEIQLFRDDVQVETVTTGPDGAYQFFIAEPGTFRVVEVQPVNFIDASESLGFVLPNDPRGNLGNNDEFVGIALDVGEQAVDYNFGEIYQPTKRSYLSSTDPRGMHCEALGVSCITVEGTAGDDDIAFSRTGDVLNVSVNGAPAQNFPLAQFDFVAIDTGAGQDTVTLEGTTVDELANFQPLVGSLRSGTDFGAPNYGALAVNAESIVVTFPDGASDTVIFRDTPASDELSVNGANVSLNEANALPGATAQNLVDVTDRVFAHSLTRTNVVEDDTVATIAAATFGLELVPTASWRVI